jgi:hypothetical protein
VLAAGMLVMVWLGVLAGIRWRHQFETPVSAPQVLVAIAVVEGTFEPGPRGGFLTVSRVFRGPIKVGDRVEVRFVEQLVGRPVPNPVILALEPVGPGGPWRITPIPWGGGPAIPSERLTARYPIYPTNPSVVRQLDRLLSSR